MKPRVLVIALMLVGATSVGIASTTAASASTARRVSTKTLFSQLAVAAKHPAGYAAWRFGTSNASHPDGCGTTQEVLISEAVVAPGVGRRCTLTGGQWTSQYDGVTITDPSQLGIDHLVSLNEAWTSGAWRWSTATRNAYANDLGYGPSLLAVSTASLQAKGTQQRQTWLPANTSFDCTYVAWWVAVKWRWQLAVDGAEQTFLANRLASCGWPSVRAPSRAKIASVLCQDWEHENVSGADRNAYQLLNIRYNAASRICIQNSANLDNFRVTQQLRPDPKGKVAAFPEVFQGCLWRGCSAHTKMPVRVSAMGHPVSTWHAKVRATGTWNAAYELWFGKHRMTTGQADGAELMVWLNLHGACCHLQPKAPTLRIDGRKFLLSHWRACSRQWKVCFNYIQFRLVHHASRVDGLRLRPFIDRAIQRHLIKRSWWLENIGAGFEIWKGGKGLATTRFSVRMRP